MEEASSGPERIGWPYRETGRVNEFLKLGIGINYERCDKSYFDKSEFNRDRASRKAKVRVVP
jgi:hypothetical protein